jgi:DHA1 family bicyclomycin/chloramphenicol resistance-like MFS transporter
MLAGLKGGPRPAGWRGDAVFVATLGALMAITPMSVDMYLPALPAIGRDLGAPQSEIQLSLSLFFVAFALGQLVWGPIGDRFGRRGPTFAGLLLFVAGGTGCMFAADPFVLAGWRTLQGAGAAVTVVLCRAMVRDVYDRDRSAAVLSVMMLVMGAAPMLAPTVGGQILRFADWRFIFAVLVAAGVAIMVPLWRMPETLPAARRRSLHPVAVARTYLLLLRDRRYIGYVAGGAGMFGAMFAYISGTPYVYIEMFGVSVENYGLLFGVNVIGMMAASAFNSRFALRFGADRVLRAGLLASIVFAAVLLATGASGAFGLWGIVVPLFAFLSCMGLIGANSMAGALADHPQMAGSASALAGGIQFATGAAAGAAVAALADETPVPMCATILALAVAGAVAHFALVGGTGRR